MDARLEVEIGADIKDLQSKVNSATKDLKDFGNDSKKSLGNFSKSTSTATKSMANFKKGAISGDSALTSFSRTIQDAPFGIMGVSNNITNLTEQFGYLKAKTGSSGSALKAMLSSLKGFGGISLLISVATSALLVFGDKIFATKDKVRDINKESKEFVEGLKSLETTLNGLSLSQDQLNAKVEDYILLQKIKANADNQEKESTEKLEKINKKLAKEKEKLAKAQRLLNANTIALGKSQDKETTRAKGYAKGIANSNDIITKSTSKINSLEKERKNVILDSLSVLKKYREQRDRLKESEAGSVAYLEKQKTLLQKEQKQVSKNSETWKDYADRIKNIQKEINNITGTTSEKIKAPVFIDFKLDDSSFEALETIDLGANDWIGDSPFNWEEYFKLKDLDTQKNLLNEKMLAVNAQMSNLIQGQLANTFSGIGQAIGNGLAQGTNVLAAVGGALIQGIGNLIASMGDKLIQLGTAAVLAGTVTKLFGAIAGVGAGMAAIAGGIALKGIGTGISSFGGAGQSNATAGGGTNNNANFSSGFSGGYANNNGGNVVFQIAGDKLIGVLKNTLNNNSSLGGNIVIG